MAQIIKKNEKVVAPFYKNGVSLQFLTITFPGDVSALTSATTAGVKSPVVQALEAISQLASIELIGTVSTTTLPIAVAALGGDFGTEDYAGDGAPETFAARCQQLIVAAAGGATAGVSLQGIANTATTVAAGVRGQTF
jgi:hypothetical protein